MKIKSLNLKIGAIAAALILIAGIAAIPVTAASANSAQKNWYGSSSSGMFVTDENCPVVVESETLTFDIKTFPANYYYVQDDFSKYDAKVTARYNFYNPADYEVNMTLAFPFGESPSYLGGHLDESGRYSVTAGGERIESAVRHTFTYGYFDAEKEVAKILDGYKEDEFFSPDMPVYYYTCKFSGNTGAAYLKNKFDNSKTAVFYSVQNGSSGEAPTSVYSYDGNGGPVAYVQDGSVIFLFVAGEDIEEPKFSMGQSWPLFDEGTSAATIVKKQEITFKEVMLAYFDEDYGVSETDWYNAATEYFSVNGCLDFYMNNSLMRWFEYRLTIPAGGRLVNEVTAPLYPDIYGDYPAVYNYKYLLSPAKCWKEFGSLDIAVNTPYYLSESSQGEFEKKDGGYVLHLDKLPDGELTFNLCEDKFYMYRPGVYVDNAAVVIFLVICGVVLGLQVVAAIPLTIVFAVTGKFSSKPKNKKL